MATKRACPLDEQPTASSEEEEASSEEEDEEDDEPAKPFSTLPAPAASSEEEDEEDDEPAKPFSTLPAPAAEKKPSSKKPPTPATKSQPKSSSSESGTESDSGSNSEDERPSGTADPKIKLIAFKPMKETPKVKKPKSQPYAKPARSATKRPNEKNWPVSDSERAKKKGTDGAGDDEIPVAEGDTKNSGDDSKKLFQRLWSEDDEIAILEGMVEYSVKTGANAGKDMNAFHDFIKTSLHVDVSRSQLMDKIRRLKKKYENNAGRGKKGKDRSFSKPHDKKAFELSKKIWATERDNGGIEHTKSNAKDGKSQKECSRTMTTPKAKAELESKEARKIDIDRNAGSSLSLSEMNRFDKILGLSGLDEDAIKRGFEVIGASQRAELEERWKKLQFSELEHFVKRAELIKDQALLLWEAYKSSNC